VLCVHSRADENVPFRYSDRCVQAAVRAGGTAYLHEASGDHFTLIATPPLCSTVPS
jgi:dipeptidyl aminopeptidase/acylaminoacyl peptidase